MCIFRLWAIAVARAYGWHWLAWVIDADLLHHSTILMTENVAVEDKVTNNAWPSEWNHDFHFTSDGHREGIAMNIERLRNTVNFQDLEIELVDVEDVQLV